VLVIVTIGYSKPVGCWAASEESKGKSKIKRKRGQVSMAIPIPPFNPYTRTDLGKTE
jgi:hypothetical protein